MKYLAISAVLITSAFSHFASARSDYHVIWNILTPIEIGDYKYNSLRLDINEGTGYLAANGVLRSDEGARPVTGTCMLVSGGSIFCSLSIDFLVLTVSLTPNLDGSINLLYQNSPDVNSALQFISAE